MASASSSSSFSKFRIDGDVFIHCLGYDIRRNFVSHLSSALLQAGVKPFLLAVEMQQEQFVASIEGFQIGIVVLTKTYFESFRCVDELVRIIECHETHGLMVMPVFYEMDRSDFENTLKATAREVMKVEHIIWSGEYRKTWFQRWNVALTKAGTLPTWEESQHRSDAELVEEIVKSVLAKLDCPLVSMSTENNDLGDLAPILSSDLNILNVLVQCDVEFQRYQQVIAILDEIRGLNLTEFEIRPSPETSKHRLTPHLIEFGSFQEEVFDILSKSIFEGSENSASCDVFLPGDKVPYWLAHMGEGHSVTFTIPEGRRIKGMTLCAVNLYNPRHMATTEYLISILMVNYTKCTIQIYRRMTVRSFSDVDWQGIISNLGPGDKVEIFVIFGDKFLVKKTAVYLMCDGLIGKEVDPSLDPKNID
ncbi:hypothetical protein LR48_Vigan521s000600 [Vigna angularis]|uniref:TIR domain-containing protein n=1 Tax=Phaseolus angularis TaxID=3914 RepID=A0A0L9TCQ2_PHAAN|nr:hypothetical protein LR48_Vigan521s000600 [Vigna angularis]